MNTDNWFGWCGEFHEGVSRAWRGAGWCFIRTDGEMLGGMYFDYIYPFRDDFANVRLDGKWAYLGKDGNILSNRWFQQIGDFDTLGYASVQREDGMWGLLGKDGKILGDMWYDIPLVRNGCIF